MKSAIAMVLLATTALAEPPADAPINLDAPGRSMTVEIGTIVPFNGVCLDPQEDIRRTRRDVRQQTKLDEYEAPDKVILTQKSLAGIIVATVLAAAAAAVAVTLAVHK